MKKYILVLFTLIFISLSCQTLRPATYKFKYQCIYEVYQGGNLLAYKRVFKQEKCVQTQSYDSLLLVLFDFVEYSEGVYVMGDLNYFVLSRDVEDPNKLLFLEHKVK